MLHTDQKHMTDKMLDDPSELIVDAQSNNCALYTTPEGDALLLRGDLSGTQEELDDKIHRFAKQMKATGRRR